MAEPVCGISPCRLEFLVGHAARMLFPGSGRQGIARWMGYLTWVGYLMSCLVPICIAPQLEAQAWSRVLRLLWGKYRVS